MYIEELDDGGDRGGKLGMTGAKRAAVGVGARVLFYPTLLYNVIRNKVQVEFRWWDQVDEFLLLGAVPFPSDVPCLMGLGVCGVITLNEPYETLVPTSLYLAHGIEHLVIPTRDYCFAPSLKDICKAVEFIHKNTSSGKTTYVHCKAGRGRSTTIVLCYLVQHKHMTPTAAYEYVRLRRPRVLLASPQWQAVQEYYCLLVTSTMFSKSLNHLSTKTSPQTTAGAGTLVTFDEKSFVVISKSDIEGYEIDCRSSRIWELSLVYRVKFAGQAALASLSCFWLQYHAQGVPSTLPDNNKLGKESSCSLEVDQLGLGHPCLVNGVVVKL